MRWLRSRELELPGGRDSWLGPHADYWESDLLKYNPSNEDLKILGKYPSVPHTRKQRSKNRTVQRLNLVKDGDYVSLLDSKEEIVKGKREDVHIASPDIWYRSNICMRGVL